MKAYIRNRYCDTDGLVCTDLPKPNPTKGEVLVKVKASSVNPADWRMMKADPFLIRFDLGLFKPKSPYLGADMAGEIVALGAEVKGFSIGDRVITEMTPQVGAYSEYVCLPVNKLVHLPNRLTFEQGASIPLAGITAYQSLMETVKINTGQHVLINGASGGVGTFAIQLAKICGAKVTAVCSGANEPLVRSIGADDVINYQTTNFRQNFGEYDVVMDCIGNIKIRDMKNILSIGGTGLMVGWGGFGQMINAFFSGGSKDKTCKFVMAKMTLERLESLIKLFDEKRITPVIDRVYKFSALPEAIRYQMKGHAKGKVVITFP